ncbi:EAL domain-containing protein [Devosia algicola]|uniref:EAL domain-containing protein n=1 Tax=Devosia algicola TaxID=3026418 RepID=A0ABY7YS72_9HYPH|nr:EAL domain-containing protein [Devosia algicola]WDR04042.1 EAL domain-containing protein [Devosia algicola]
MHSAVRLFAVTATVIVLFALAQFGAFRSFDRIMADMRFASSNAHASQKTLVVEIDSKSLADVGVWPWPRHLYADLLDRLMADGADEVAFDIDFSNPSAPDEDKAFAAALERAGGYAFLAAFQQFDSAGSGLTLTMPQPDFRRQADPVLVNVVLDQNGQALAFPSYAVTPEATIPSLPAKFTQVPLSRPDLINIDFGIDADSIERVSFVDALNGRVDPVNIQGRQIIVGGSAIELRDFFQIPRFGIVSGPLLQALGVETLRAGRTVSYPGAVPAALAALFFALLAVALRSRLSITMLALLALTLMLGWELAAFLSYRYCAIMLDSSVFHLAMLIFMGLAVANEALFQYQGRQQALQRLAYLATNDVTTGTLTRRGFLAELDNAPTLATIVLVHINRMDILRASVGHRVANQTLVAIAQDLKKFDLGPIGYVAPDTFALTAPTDGNSSAQTLCQRLSSALSRTYLVEQQNVHVDVACAYAAGADDPATLMNHAEIALIKAASAPSSIGAFIATDKAALDRRRTLDLALRQALDNGQLWVAYQPLVDLRSRRIVGAEALLRWQHPEFGNIPPDQFIPLAEETGLIVELGSWVLHQACTTANSWDWQGRISVNVSAVQMALTDLPRIVDAALKASNLPANRLKLEITESSMASAAARTLEIFATLADMGVGVALDDFGTGYSSLSYLKDLPFETLKVDQSFVRNMDQDETGMTLVKTIVDLANSLGKNTVAEGIEHEHHAIALRDMGCVLGQGYLFSRPIKSEEMAALLAESAA